MQTTEVLTLISFQNNEKGEDYIPMMGGDSSNPTWEEYKASFKDEYKPHIELVKETILNAENGLYKITGEQKQDMDVSFLFSDGTHFGFTWRAWGDLMQAIVGKREGYMAYYM